MAYNLESLVRIAKQILHPDQQQQQPFIDPHKKPQLESLLDKASSLKQFVGNSCQQNESLEIQIRDAAHEAEDIIESHIVDQMLSNPGADSFTISPPDLQHVINTLDSAMDKANNIVDGTNPRTLTSVLSRPDLRPKDIVVGLDEDLFLLKDGLTGQRTNLEIISIVGMGGIGKTTLAQTLYNDPLIVSHFDTRAWITISQDYDVRAILLGIIECIIGKLTDELLIMTNNQLAVILHKSLWGIRYLIVLDDMWSTDAWDEIKWFFPNENQRSRILLTTRESDVANYANSSGSQHQMHLLNEPDSWNLLRQEVFGREDFSTIEFETIGKTIARNCEGHPLAIHVIGGLLSDSDRRTKEFWNSVAEDTRAAVAESGHQFANIFSLSYNHLPHHLRPCFLYMGAFPEDYNIRRSKLLKLWVAEGFLKPDGDKSLEEAADVYLQGLVNRNLISISQCKSNGKAKSYSIHDLLRDLCVRKADQEKFFCVKNGQAVQDNSSYIGLCRVSVHPSYQIRDIHDSKEYMLSARSFLCFRHALEEFTTLSPLICALRLLRVLDIIHIKFKRFPTEILEMVNLRYLALSISSALPSEISRLRNLQTLILDAEDIREITYMPFQVWEMPELRHVEFRGRVLFIEDNYTKSSAQESLKRSQLWWI